MRICFIADYSSPTAVNWIEYFIRRGDEVHVISTGRSAQSGGAAQVYSLYGDTQEHRARRYHLPDPSSFLGKAIQKVYQSIIAPNRVRRYAAAVKQLVDQIQPDLLHALRIPIEGELGMLTGFHPFVVSIWGNDLTLHARNSPVHRILTKQTLATADAVLADCAADLTRTARILGVQKAVTLVVPGGGGVRQDIFGPGADSRNDSERWSMLAGRPVIVNPRGVRTYVRHDTVFRALRLVKEQISDVLLVSAGLKDWAPAKRWVHELGIADNILLTGMLHQEELSSLFRMSQISVSISEHDGTPNSLLEAMASGAVPICGDLESTREWIQPGINGWLVSAQDPQELADCILKTLSDTVFQQKAQQLNQTLTRERATYPDCMRPVEDLYMRVANQAAMLSGQKV